MKSLATMLSPDLRNVVMAASFLHGLDHGIWLGSLQSVSPDGNTFFDGLIVEHREDAELGAELLEAVQGDIEKQTGYRVVVEEKPLQRKNQNSM